MKISFIISITTILSFSVSAQSDHKKIMDHDVFDFWNKIENVDISDDGHWVSYNINPHKGDGTLVIYNTENKTSISFDRATDASFNDRYIQFILKPSFDSIQTQKRKKLKEEDLSKDSLGIYHLKSKKLTAIANLESFKTPKEKIGWLAYKLTPAEIQDSSKTENKDNGSTLVIRNLEKSMEDSLFFVKDYHWSDDGAFLVANTTGKDSTDFPNVTIYYPAQRSQSVIWQNENGEIKNLSIDEQSKNLSFLSNTDTTKSSTPPYQLNLWKTGNASSKVIMDSDHALLKKDWNISENRELSFSKDGKYLFFGIAEKPLEQDTTLLEEEIVNVEVWASQNQMLFTEQEVKLKNDLNHTNLIAYNIEKHTFNNTNNSTYPEVQMSEEASDHALIFDERKYRETISWEGLVYKDVAIVNLKTGKHTAFAFKEQGFFQLSPNGKYVYWYNSPDSLWRCYNIQKNRVTEIADNSISKFYDETNDRPMHPYSNGIAGWTEGDEYMLVYDKYDIWKIDPLHKNKAVNLTNGRSKNLTYRYVQLDKEETQISLLSGILLQFSNEKDKTSGYAWLDGKSLTELMSGPYLFRRSVTKAKESDDIIFTKENFQTFPDLVHSNLRLQKPITISDANPQQKDYRWGAVELVEWKDYNGKTHQGMLFKPEGFEAHKKYPMIVNFYERSSNGLYRHRAPFAHRSTINYSFYVNRGYVIFNPDVHYKNGYPGESCYNSVMSGIEHIEQMGFIDKERIGVQGHSWGGYQIAHLITKTNKFKCAESGAPVVNMFSAYGGIRWGSGLSRMFQYEHTQSRIGKTIWEDFDLYKENSPLFNLDQVNTPVLIMHNDQDGAVPWYQGIEFFVAMRRLGKDAWMLNYNGEPHWPLKRQNRLDFNKRMQQFFDYYLLGAPMPKWMRDGVSAREKGILQGLQLIDGAKDK